MWETFAGSVVNVGSCEYGIVESLNFAKVRMKVHVCFQYTLQAAPLEGTTLFK